MNRYHSVILLSVMSLLCCSIFPVFAEDTGYDFSFSLPAPSHENDKAYLGLKGQEKFKLVEIQSDVILVQIFSMYCPICQGEAAHVNQVFEKIKNNKTLSRNIRMIGIGVGNSLFEADFFRSNYNVEFPMFSDDGFVIHKMVKEVGTPHFFALRRQTDRTLKLVFSHSGRVPDPQAFLKNLISAAGLEAEQ